MMKLTLAAVLLAAEAPESGAGGMLTFSRGGYLFAIVNFLILVALLYRFLHKPLLNVLAARRKRLEDAEAAAAETTRRADETRKQYEEKLGGIAEERDRLLAEARRRAEQTREELLQKARAEAERQAANMKRDADRRRQEALEALQGGIVDASLALVRRILADLAGSDIEAELRARLDGLLDELAGRSDEDLRRDLFDPGVPVNVVSVRPLADEEKDGLRTRIGAIAGGPVEVRFDTDADLVAGVRVEFSSMAVDSSLADVLAAARERFEELAPEPDADGQQAEESEQDVEPEQDAEPDQDKEPEQEQDVEQTEAQEQDEEPKQTEEPAQDEGEESVAHTDHEEESAGERHPEENNAGGGNRPDETAGDGDEEGSA